MKWIYLLGGLFIILLPTITAKQKLAAWKVQKHGTMVNVVVTTVPFCFYKRGADFRFSYEGAYYSKNAPCSFLDRLHRGDTVQLKTIEGSGVFLLEKENAEAELFAMIAIALLGIFFLYRFFSYSRISPHRVH